MLLENGRRDVSLLATQLVSVATYNLPHTRPSSERFFARGTSSIPPSWKQLPRDEWPSEVSPRLLLPFLTRQVKLSSEFLTVSKGEVRFAHWEVNF